MRWPPSQEAGGNPVNVTMYLTDLKNFDESHETIAVYALINIEWEDLRWWDASYQRVEKACKNRTGGCSEYDYEKGEEWAAEAVLSAVFGQTAASFFESTNGFGGSLSFVMAGNVWTPIPQHLLLKTTDNPLGKTEFDPLIRIVDAKNGIMEATWVDRAETEFDVTLEYEYFPFDNQLLDLCLPFDYFADPTFRAWKGVDTRAGTPLELENVSVRWNFASRLSELASQRFVTELERKGFEVTSIQSIKHDDSAIGSSICLEITVVRRITILILRFFFPLFSLLFIPFAGFFIPIEQVMPRVATGFISFLSLQVFRTMAYSLIPKQSSSLLWMDVTMFSVTVIMFASVLENVLAPAMRANISSISARFVDNLSRVTFPMIGLCLLVVLFIMGAMNVDNTFTMVVCLSILTFWLVSFAVAVILCIRRLPATLMKTLVRRISSTDFRYMNSIPLDPMELKIVFKTIDTDRSGNITADEVLKSFAFHGLSFAKEEDEANFKSRLRSMFELHGTGTNNRLDLNAFCHHFGAIFRFYSLEEEEEMELIEEEKAAIRQTLRMRQSLRVRESVRESRASHDVSHASSHDSHESQMGRVSRQDSRKSEALSSTGGVLL